MHNAKAKCGKRHVGSVVNDKNHCTYLSDEGAEEETTVRNTLRTDHYLSPEDFGEVHLISRLTKGGIS